MASTGGAAGRGNAVFQDVSLSEDGKGRTNSPDNRLVTRDSSDKLNLPLSCFDRFKKMLYSKEEWEAYLIEKMEKLQQRRLKGAEEQT